MRLGATEMRDKADHAERTAGSLMAAAAELDKYGAAGAVASAELIADVNRLREEHTAWDDAATLMDAATHIRRVADNPPGNPAFRTEAFQQAMLAAADRLDSKSSDIVELYGDH